MSNKIKFEHIKKLWYLKDGVIYTRWGNKPKTFPSKSNGGRRFQMIKVNGKHYIVHIHEALFMLFHDRPIAEGKEIHHKDGDPENNAIDNLVELTRTQHRRIHLYQCNDPLRGIDLNKGAWRLQWYDDNGRQHGRRFHGINDAMDFRATIEEPRRQELRALGLNCMRVVSGEKSAAIRPSKIYFSRSNAIL